MTLLSSGTVEISAGLQILNDFPNSLTNAEGQLLQFPVIAASVGLGSRTEFQIAGSCFNHLDEGNESLLSSGDFSLFTKIRIVEEGPYRPSFGFRYGVKLPNANETKGVGTNETDFHGELLVDKQMGRFRLFGSAGIAILGSTQFPSSQDDLLTYGIAGELTFDAFSLIGDFNGSVGDASRNASRLIVGLKLPFRDMCLDASLLRGFQARAERWGFSTGVTFDFQAF